MIGVESDYSDLIDRAEERIMQQYSYGPDSKHTLMDGIFLLYAWVIDGGDDHLSKLYTEVILDTNPEFTSSLSRSLHTLNIGYYAEVSGSADPRYDIYASIENLIQSL